MVKKIFLFGIMLTMSLGLLIGCEKTKKITDFDGMRDLPRNPIKIVFGTNSMNFNEENGIYGEPIEYKIQSEKFYEIIEKLFAISYEALPKDIAFEEMSQISHYLILYDANGNTWNVNLGLKLHNDRIYSPVNDDDLISLLYEVIIF